MFYFDWNDENMVLLEHYLRNGDSAGQIAKQLGCPSRNAVIGKIHRTKHLNEIGLGGNATKSEKLSLAAIRNRRIERAAKAIVVKEVKVSRIHPGNIVRKKARRAVEKPEPLPMPAVSSLEYETDCLRLLIHELGPRQCKWEVNNAPLGEDHLFCGLKAEECKPYCTHHARRAAGIGTESERSATRMAIHLGRKAA